jgi:hypothetical protein
VSDDGAIYHGYIEHLENGGESSQGFRGSQMFANQVVDSGDRVSGQQPFHRAILDGCPNFHARAGMPTTVE